MSFPAVILRRAKIADSSRLIPYLFEIACTVLFSAFFLICFFNFIFLVLFRFSFHGL